MKHKLAIIALGCLIAFALFAGIYLLPQKKEADVYLRSVTLLDRDWSYTIVGEGKYMVTILGTIRNDGTVRVSNTMLNVDIHAYVGGGKAHYEFNLGSLEPHESRSFTQSFIFYSPEGLENRVVDIYLTY